MATIHANSTDCGATARRPRRHRRARAGDTSAASAEQHREHDDRVGDDA